MKVDLYERAWIYMAGGMIALFLGAVLVAAGSHAIHPPSHMETIDPARVRTEGAFATDLGAARDDEGAVIVHMVAELYAFRPQTVRVPAGVPVTFRLTSPDVIHGFQVVGTNLNATVVPGYISQMTTTFRRPGEHLVVCNEYCGVAHHLMHARVVVEAAP